MLNKKTCLMPWVHLATLSDGNVQLCCVAKNDSKLNLNNQSIIEIWNSEYYKKSRLDLLDGKEIPQCQTCWKEESSGIESHRNISNKIIERELGQERIEQLINESRTSQGSISQLPIAIDFRLGNTCNLTCVMCRPADSSKWIKPAKQMADLLQSDIKIEWKHKSNIDVSLFDWYKKQEFWEDFYKIAPNIRHITFGGGEPLLIKEQKELIKHLISIGLSKKIELLYHTNGTIYDEEMIEYWKQFRGVKLMLSIDGVGEVNDYVRRPASWDVVSKNLKKYDQTPDNIVVSINCTVQVTNILKLTEFAQWILDQNFKKVGKESDGGIFFASVLHWPVYLDIQVLPKHLKLKVSNDITEFVEKNKESLPINRLLEVIEFMNRADRSSMFDQTLDYFSKLDSLSNGKYRLEVTGLR